MGHFRFDQAGSDAIDADTLWGEGLATASGQRDHARLGRTHNESASSAAGGPPPTRSSTIRPKPRSIISSLTANTTRYAPFRVHVDRLAPPLHKSSRRDPTRLLIAPQWASRSIGPNCSRVSATSRVDVRRLGDIARHDRSPCAPGPGPRRRPARRRGARGIADGDVGPLAGQPQCSGPADAARAARHQGHAGRERVGHLCLALLTTREIPDRIHTRSPLLDANRHCLCDHIKSPGPARWASNPANRNRGPGQLQPLVRLVFWEARAFRPTRPASGDPRRSHARQSRIPRQAFPVSDGHPPRWGLPTRS